MRKRLILASLIAVAFIITCVAIATGSYFNEGLVMEIGAVSQTRVRATEDIVDEAATAENRAAALVLAEGLIRHYTVDPGEWPVVENNLVIRRRELVSIREAYADDLAAYEEALAEWDRQYGLWRTAENNWQTAAATARDTQQPYPPPHGVQHPGEPPQRGDTAMQIFEDLVIPYAERRFDDIVALSDDEFEQMWEVIDAVAHHVQHNVVIHQPLDDRTEFFIREARDEMFGDVLPGEIEVLADFIMSFSLLRNAMPDEERNEREFQRQASDFETVWIYQNDIIVDEGEIITPQIYEIMRELGMLAPESLLDILYPMLGVFFLVAVLFLASVMYLMFYREGMASNTREAILLFTLYVLNVALVWTLGDFGFPFLTILIFPMLVSILIDRRVATALTFVLIIICFFIVDGDLTYLLFYAASGMLFCMFSRYTTERGKSIWIGLLISAIMFALAVGVILITERNAVFDGIFSMLFLPAIFAAASGILTVFLCMGSLPLWETFFGVVTPVKLLDLTNPTNLLLRRLTIEAPGTYHHSLIVANLAETAAYDIGANAHAARVGGYYHDVGKLKFPHYFVENLDGENPHDHLDPVNSSQIIMSHVAYGLTLATEHRLPQFVRDIIKEHHGTTLMQYFFSKAREMGEQYDEKDFRYPYTIPQTRESACVMLADSVEAAVRSMIPKISSVDEVEKTIRFIIRGKLNDGQLADSKLSIHDVTVIEQSFFRVLKGMYHERIAYPAPPVKAKA